MAVIKLKIQLDSIPLRTMRNIRGVPSTAGLARSAYPPRRARMASPAKASRPSWWITVEKDESLDKEIKDWKEKSQ